MTTTVNIIPLSERFKADSNNDIRILAKTARGTRSRKSRTLSQRTYLQVRRQTRSLRSSGYRRWRHQKGRKSSREHGRRFALDATADEGTDGDLQMLFDDGRFYSKVRQRRVKRKNIRKHLPYSNQRNPAPEFESPSFDETYDKREVERRLKAGYGKRFTTIMSESKRTAD